MKRVLLTLLLVIGMITVTQAQIQFGKKEYFNVSLSIDPSATIKEESPNVVGEIELVNYGIYVKAGVQTLPGLQGGYTDTTGAFGLNVTTGPFEDFRFYTGVRLGFIFRGEYTYPLAGAEGGVDYNVNDDIFVGLRSTYDQREDFMYSGAEPSARFSGFVRVGYKF